LPDPAGALMTETRLPSVSRQHSSGLIGSQPGTFGMMILKFLRASGQRVREPRHVGAEYSRGVGPPVRAGEDDSRTGVPPSAYQSWSSAFGWPAA